MKSRLAQTLSSRSRVLVWPSIRKASAVSMVFWGTSIVHYDFNSTELESFYSYPSRVGPIDLTQGTVIGENEVPTVVNNLYSEGTITAPTLGVFFAPTTSDSVTNG